MSAAKKIFFTENDFETLDALSERYPESGPMVFLEKELARAEVVSDEKMLANVVTLHSRICIYDENTTQERELTIVPPQESALAEGQVSVLAPLGAAVIGLSEGQAINWTLPSGKHRRFRVVKVLYQPEAARKNDHEKGHSIDVVEQASLESFPASDAPSWRL